MILHEVSKLQDIVEPILTFAVQFLLGTSHNNGP